MNITLLNVTKATKVGPSGKPYEVLDLAYKNNTFQGKVEGKALLPFGANQGSFNVLKNAQPGQTYEITVVKNDKNFNDWTAATPAEVGAQAAPQSNPPQVYQQASKAPNAATSSARTNTFETPEERAKKQVWIIRQSTLSNAVNSLSVGSKTALDPDAVEALAKRYEAFVFREDKPEAETVDFDDVPD